MSFCLKFAILKNAIYSKIRCKDLADSQIKLHTNSNNFRNKFSVMYIISSFVNNW